MAERVGGVYYEVEARNAVERGLRDAREDVARFAAEVEAVDPSLDVEVNTRRLKRGLAEVQAWKKAVEADAAEIEVRMSAGGLSEKELLAYQKSLANLQRQSRSLTVVERRLQSAQKSLGKEFGYTSVEAAKQAAQIDKLRERYNRLADSRARLNRTKFKTEGERLQIRSLTSEMAKLEAEARRLGGSMDDVSVDAERGRERLVGLARSVLYTRLHIGFLSTTIAGAAKGLVLFSPVIVGTIGVLSSLVGVLGTGIAGAAAVSAAGLAGFGLAAFGLTRALTPMAQELDTAWDAMTKYEEQVMETGKNSEEAREKLADLHTTLKAMGPDAAKAFEGFAKARAQFQRETGALRRPFFDTISEGLKTATALMPIFTRETVATGRVVARETQDWFKALRSDEAKDILGDVMGNFRRSLPGIFGGLGQIGAALGRISQSASRFLPSLTGGFEEWATNLADSVGSGDRLDSRVGRLIGHMRQLGHTTQAGGRAIATFFSAGADEGESMMKSLQRTFNGWNRWMRSVEGQASLRDFFADSRQTVSAFLPALGHLATTIANLADASEPLVTGFSQVLSVGTSIIAALPPGFLRLTGVVLGLGWALRKLSLLGPISAALGALGASSAAAGAGSTAAAGGLAALGARAVPVAGVIVGGALALEQLDHALRGTDDSAQRAVDGYTVLRTGAEAARVSTTRLNAAQRAGADAQARIARLTKQGATGSREYRDAVRDSARAEEQSLRAMADRAHAAVAIQDGLDRYRDLQGEVNEATEEWAKAAASGSPMADMLKAKVEVLAAALDTQMVSTLNAARGLRGLKALPQELGPVFNQFNRMFGKKATLKVGLAGDRNVASQIARIGTQAGKLGGKQQVLRIVANSKNAEQALAKLQALMDRLKPKPLNLKARTDDVVAAFHKVESTKLDDKEVRVRARDNASPVIGSINAKLNSLHDKTITVTTIERVVRQATPKAFFSGGPVPAYASGVDPSQRLLDRAAQSASRRASRRAGPGAEITRPTMLTGEIGGDNEWVITDNPNWRRSNAGYLMDAAQALGYVLIPAFAKGGKKQTKAEQTKAAVRNTKKGKKALGRAAPANPLVEAFEAAEANQEYWAEEYDLDRRSYDSGIGTGGIEPGFAIGDLKFDIQRQIDEYTAMMNLLPQIGKLNKIPSFDVPSGIKKKGVRKQAKATKNKIDAYNEAVDSAKGAADQYTVRGIRHLIQALELERLEIEQAQNSNTILGTTQANLARYEAYKQYSSNVAFANGLGLGAPGASAGAAVTPPTGGFAVPSSVSGAMSLASTPPSLAGPAPSGDPTARAGTTITNNFAAPPPDAHTWAHQQAFEVAAL